MNYQPKNFEQNWTKKWLDSGIYKMKTPSAKATPPLPKGEIKEGVKFYSLYSFPYPSGAGLHVGHAEGMVANDIVARYWRMKGRNVVLPMGWDSFGLPAENYAIKTGTPPEKTTEEAVKTFYEQINRLGISVDWETEVGAHRPSYYKWTQWIFLQLFKNKLAYKKMAPVNWCPKDQTVLANEQVIKELRIKNEELRIKSDHYYSYLMGGENISDEDLSMFGIEIIDRKDQDRMLKIPVNKIENYKTLIKEKLSNGFWNEYIGNEIVFIFKNKDGNIEEYILNSENEKTICNLAAEYTNDKSFREKSIVEWLFDNSFYSQFTDIKQALIDSLKSKQEIEVGVCERCGTEVIQKDMEQWFFKITEFADRLDKDLDKVDWPEGTKQQQRNWIGKSVGAEIIWGLRNPETNIEFNIHTFTTRFDTIPGPTFMVVAPEYSNLDKLVTQENRERVAKYVEEAKNKTDLERQANKEKTGVFTGSYAINPFNNDEVPIYVADYVLAGYGTGAVMGMPGHDQRDWEFANKFDLPIKYSMRPVEGEIPQGGYYEGEGYEINSGEFDGLFWTEARDKIIEKLVSEGKAVRKTNYRLRDWLISRQRYWGCPIPIVYDPEGNPHAMDEKDLPLLLPTDVDFLPTGESPIARSESFRKLAEEKYGAGWHFEVDTMDTFVDSSWYFFRHIDANNDEKIFDSEKANYWLPIDLYMIGAEHTVLHLLYSRFFTKFFFDQGLINFDEPFYFMRHMGTILGSDGRKMSKRWGNVINPTDEAEKYGADTVRMYEMFMGPLDEAKPWNDRAENGVFRFLNKVWDLQGKIRNDLPAYNSNGINQSQAGKLEMRNNEDTTKSLSLGREGSHHSAEVEMGSQQIEINKLIKKVSDDTEKLSFNTAVAKFMEFTNFLQTQESIDKNVWETFLKLLAPYAPFITEELWSGLGNTDSIHLQEWPKFDETLLRDEQVKIAVQINGKVRGVIEIKSDAEEAEALELARQDNKIQKYLTSEPKKVVYVKGRILNIIV